ncbi:MAG: hypothetical protein ACI4TV_00655 [Paludibacteraceae bacterium]
MSNLHKDWLSAFEGIGCSAISKDTAARILAVVFVHGNNEALVYNESFINDMHHIQTMYGIAGGETPDADVVELVKQYVNELENYIKEHRDDERPSGVLFTNPKPEWAQRLFLDRYRIILIN